MAKDKAIKAIKASDAPKRVIIPLSQHIGAPCQSIVQIGQEVKKGEVIGTSQGFVSAPVHSSVSGRVVSVGEFPTPVGRMSPAIVIENDFKEEWASLTEHADYLNLSPEELKKCVMAAGIVGMGGAAFPTHVKLSPPKEKLIDLVIINGAECEPYLTADYRLMLEQPDRIVEGLKMLMRIVGVQKAYIGIEANKQEAIDVMRVAVANEPGISVEVCEVKYPQGAEKMLIKAVADREVPARGLPMDVGVVVQNVGTAVAVYDAVRYGRPLIERVITVSGEGIKEPANLMVKIGTLVSDVLKECGGLGTGRCKGHFGRADDGLFPVSIRCARYEGYFRHPRLA